MLLTKKNLLYINNALGALQGLFELYNHSVAKLDGLGLAAKVASAETAAANLLVVEHLPHGELDSGCFSVQAKRVAEEEGSGEDGTDWVSDALASDIRRLYSVR